MENLQREILKLSKMILKLNTRLDSLQFEKEKVDKPVTVSHKKVLSKKEIIINEFQMFMGVEDVALISGLMISKIRNMVIHNEIPFIKTGRLVRFNREDIINFLKKGNQNE